MKSIRTLQLERYLDEARTDVAVCKRREELFKLALTRHKVLLKCVVLQRDLKPDAAPGTIQDANARAVEAGEQLEAVLRELFPGEYAEHPEKPLVKGNPQWH